MAKKAYVYDGSAWVDLASSNTDLSSYSTTSQMNTAIDAASGLTLISSTALTGSSVSINNCFSATYKTYRMILEFVPSGGMQVRLRLRVGGVDDTSNVYKYSQNYILPTGSIGVQDNGNPLTYYNVVDGVATNASNVSADISNPFNAVPTRFSGTGTLNINGLLTYCVFGNSTAFDGLTITASAGTFTSGTVKIYGYKD